MNALQRTMNLERTLLAICAAATLLLAVDAAAAADPVDADRRVLVLLGEQFFANEFWEPYYAMKASGYEVVVASGEAGRVKSWVPFDDAVSLEGLDAADFVALYVPGGKGPENLESYPRALELCRAFRDRGKLLAAMCHGPRLLMTADVIDQRTFTVLWKVASELPEQWRQQTRGAYVDEATVLDGDLLTARCPWDSLPFTRALLHQLGERSGLPAAIPEKRTLLVVDPEATLPWRMAFVSGGLAAMDVEIKHVTPAMLGPGASDGEAAPAIELDGTTDGILVLPGKKTDQLDAMPTFDRMREVAEEKGVPVRRLEGEPMAALRETVGWLRGLESSATDGSAADSAPKRQAVLALSPGFDGKVAAAMLAWLEAKGMAVTIVGPTRGWMRGLNGMPMKATKSYADAAPQQAGHAPQPPAWIVMPGGIAPDGDPAPGEAERVQWVLDHYRAGARVVAFGFDSYELAKHSDRMFEGDPMTGSDQTHWEMTKFGVEVKEYAELVQTTDRLWTARGFSSVGPVWEAISNASGEE